MGAEGEALVVGVRRSGGLAFPAHAYIGVTDDAFPGVTATEEGRADGLGRHRLEFAAGAAEATVTVTVAFDGERRQDRVLGATLDSAELEVDGVRRPYELVTPTLVVPVTEGDAGLSVADARVEGKSSVLAFTVSLDRTRDVAVRVDYATEDGAARAGEDYTPVSGTLVIEAGGREGTVEVPVLPALHVTGERTLTLRLSNAVSAVIDDGVATGVIVHESELPKAVAGAVRADGVGPRGAGDREAARSRAAGDTGDGGGPSVWTACRWTACCWGCCRRADGGRLRLLRTWRPGWRRPLWRLRARRSAAWTRIPAPLACVPARGVGLRARWDRESFADAGETLRRAVLPDFGFRLPGRGGSAPWAPHSTSSAERSRTWAAAHGRRGAGWRRRASRETREGSRSTATW